MNGLEVRDAVVEYRTRAGATVRAVAGLSLTVGPGEVVGLVGESGCGKSSLGRAIVGLEKLQAGTIELDGRPLHALGLGRRPEHDRRVQMVFQNPYASLNPRRRIGDQLRDGMPPGRGSATAEELLVSVGLPAGAVRRYPHEFSGGQRQRIAIARVLAAEPSVIVADEPVSALDASTREQVSGLLRQLAVERGVGVLLISHDLAGVRQIADRVEVMYLGRIVESGPTESVWNEPLHPYTAALLAAIPTLGIDAPRPEAPRGEVPDPAAPPSGCRFHPRCPLALDTCSVDDPAVRMVTPQHGAACVLQPAGGPAVPVRIEAAR